MLPTTQNTQVKQDHEISSTKYNNNYLFTIRKITLILLIKKMVRCKNRYIVLEANCENQSKDDSLTLNTTKLFNSIIKKLQELHGDYGVAAIRNGFTVKYVNAKTRIGIIRVRHGPHQLILSCLPFVQTVDQKKINLTVLYAGATIRQCFKFVLNYQKKKVDEICVGLKNDEEKKEVEKVLMDFDVY